MKRFSQLIILIVVFTGISSGIFLLYKNSTNKIDLIDPTISTENVTNPKNDIPFITYSNPFQTYSISYPQDWQQNEQKYFSDDNTDLLSSELTLTKKPQSPNEAQIKIQDYNQTCSDNQLVGYGERTTSEVIINNQEALKIESSDNPQFKSENSFLTVFLIKKTNTCIEISIWQNNNKAYSAEIDKILNTFN
jgi:hypothetical protein